jgi:hypothetical protein
MNPRPSTASEAVARALALVGHGVYELGTGDLNTPDDGPSDCAGFAIDKCYQVPRHRPAFNRGNPSGVAVYDVEDDINTNAALGDAFGARDLFAPVGRRGSELLQAPQLGDLLMCPTIRIVDAHGEVHNFIGHVVIVVGVDRWDGTWASLDIVQMHGPDGRRPGINAGTGVYFDEHDETWPLDKHCSWLLRVVP